MLSPNRYFHFLYLIFKMIKKNRRNITAPFIVWEDDNPQHLIPQVEQSERDHLDVRVSRIEESVERFVDSMRIVFQLTKLSIRALRSFDDSWSFIGELFKILKKCSQKRMTMSVKILRFCNFSGLNQQWNMYKGIISKITSAIRHMSGHDYKMKSAMKYIANTFRGLPSF